MLVTDVSLTTPSSTRLILSQTSAYKQSRRIRVAQTGSLYLHIDAPASPPTTANSSLRRPDDFTTPRSTGTYQHL